MLLAAHQLGFVYVRDFGDRSVISVATAYLTLLQKLLATLNLLLALRALSYEMASYLLVVGLFTVRQHWRSAAVAVVLAVVAASVAAGAVLPVSALSGVVGTGRLIALAAVFMAVAICCASAGSAVLRMSGGVLDGALALSLVAFNSTVALWEGPVILAVTAPASSWLGVVPVSRQERQCIFQLITSIFPVLW